MLGYGAASPHMAQAEGSPAISPAPARMPSKPLVVIRFNQPHLYYDQQLYTAVSQAVATKAGVMFDIVASAPATGDATKDAQWIALSSKNTQGVVASMQSMGVPLERMHITGQTQPGLRYDETQIYAR